MESDGRREAIAAGDTSTEPGPASLGKPVMAGVALTLAAVALLVAPAAGDSS